MESATPTATKKTGKIDVKNVDGFSIQAMSPKVQILERTITVPGTNTPTGCLNTHAKAVTIKIQLRMKICFISWSESSSERATKAGSGGCRSKALGPAPLP